MNWFDKISQKIEKIAISNITAYLVGICIISSLFFKGSMIGFLNFNITLILKGEVWRIFTWLLMPSGSDFLTLLFLVFLIPFGRGVENIIGKARMNTFYLCGFVTSVLCGFIQYFITYAVTGGAQISPNLALYNILTSTLVLMGMFMPDTVVQLYFVIPIKMKYMIVFYIFISFIQMYEYYKIGNIGVLLFQGTPIFYALLNVFIVFFAIKRKNRPRKTYGAFYGQSDFSQKRKEGFSVVKNTKEQTPRHKCAVCGKTDIDSPDMVFRYCSRCNGNYEYCMDHLYTHQHIVK
ncbi:hypothetical protein [Lachnobacterium bovis]|uniref:Membrane associated serine protease, rhomboid family n=1 Tax=Lachnobacterium bovis TaxID=140626 RepID=A0A1H9RE07_9FIRM|nr:hypothetical protein [Lachnobacterium bovis]SER70942.1 hypothetical protein SAMN02910429_00833 [Lachnobacterium bovis]